MREEDVHQELQVNVRKIDEAPVDAGLTLRK
jgi:hypothetical protein